jgi:ribosomal protein L21
MYAIVVDGGRQYKVTEGLELEVDYRDLAAGSALEFKRVLAFSDGSSLKLGAPELAGAVVTSPTPYQDQDRQDPGWLSQLARSARDIWANRQQIRAEIGGLVLCCQALRATSSLPENWQDH